MYTVRQWIRSNPQIPRSAEQKDWNERQREANAWKPARAPSTLSVREKDGQTPYDTNKN